MADKPLYDKFLENLNLFENDIYSSELDLTNIGGVSLLLGIDEAAKNLLRLKNPELTKDQADMIVSPKKILEQKRQQREAKRKQKEEEKALTKEQKQQLSAAEKEKKRKDREARRKKREENQKKRIEEYKKIFKEKIKKLKAEVKKVIEDLKKAAKQLWQGFKEVIKGLVNAVVQTASAIAGIIIIMSSPPWNVPQAISHGIVVVEQYLGLLQMFKNLLPWLKPFEMLPLVCEKKNLKIIASIFNPIIQGLRAFWTPIRALDGLIKNLLNSVSSYIKNNTQKIFREATRKLKKFGHLYRFWFIHPTMKGKITIPVVDFDIPNPFFPGVIRGESRYNPQNADEYPCYYFEEDDIGEIQSLLAQFVVGFEGNKSRNRVVAYRRKNTSTAKEFSDKLGFKFPKIGQETSFGDELDLDEIDELFDRLNNGTDLPPIDNITSPTNIAELENQDRFVYDVELPDGTIIQNITEEGIEFYQQNYILKYLNAATASYKQALDLI